MNDFMYEDGHSKAVKKRIKQKKDNNEKRMLNELNYKHSYSDATGKHGTVKMGNGPEVDFHLVNKKHESYYGIKDNKENKLEKGITISKNIANIKGSDLTGTHEYAHALQYKGDRDENIKRLKYGNDTSEENKKLIKNHEKRYGVKLNDHDVRNDEIEADAFSIVNTHGKNNVNRSRRNLNEHTRRTLQSKESKIQKSNNQIQEQINQLDKNGKKGIVTSLAKKLGKHSIKLGNKEKKNIDKQKDIVPKQHEARFSVANDYAKANKDKIKNLI